MTTANLLLISGIGPGYTGVGRIISHLNRQAEGDPTTSIHWATRKATSLSQAWSRRDVAALANEVAKRSIDALRWHLARKRDLYRLHPHLVLLHPQTLGVAWLLQLVERRASTDLYVMDASFFCRSSYNHRSGSACLDCVGTDGAPGLQHNCRRWPIDVSEVDQLITGIQRHARTGRVRFLVQNPAQGELIRQHCGPASRVAVVGLWSDEWAAPPPRPTSDDQRYDVVFHGADTPAKGSRWAIRLAELCPQLRFLFPFARPAIVAPMPNVDFIPCTWETGLGAAISACRIALNPSLWSAPIEGALVKSIRWAPATAVVRLAGSYASELPDGLTWSLPEEPNEAARSLVEAVRTGWCVDQNVREAWWNSIATGRDTLSRIKALGNHGMG